MESPGKQKPTPLAPYPTPTPPPALLFEQKAPGDPPLSWEPSLHTASPSF